MSISLNNKVAIVTGSNQGIGLRTAQVLAEAGAAVIMNAYSVKEQAELEQQAQAIVDAGGKAVAVVADVSDEAGADEIVAAADSLGGSDILVNIAGGLIARVPISDYDADHFSKVIDANLKTAFNMSSKVLVAMKAKKSGRIINFSSQAAHDGGGPGAGAYAASKAAVWTFTKSLAKEVGPDGITCNCISPGFIAGTSFHTTFTAPEVREKVKDMVPLKRLGQPDDIANVVLFLASEYSGYITGQTIEVNGGLYML